MEKTWIRLCFKTIKHELLVLVLMGCSDILYACQCIMHYSAIHTALDIYFLCMVVHSLNPHVTILQCILTWPSSKTIVQSILYLQLFIYIHNVRVVFLWIGREQRIWESQRDSSWEFHFLNWSITVHILSQSFTHASSKNHIYISIYIRFSWFDATENT